MTWLDLILGVAIAMVMGGSAPVLVEIYRADMVQGPSRVLWKRLAQRAAVVAILIILQVFI